MAALYIGSCDSGKIPSDPVSFLRPYHNVAGVLKTARTFRDDDRSTWRHFRNDEGDKVRDLQTFLFDAGFSPRSDKGGIFGYVTQASVRLFQEYVRTIEGVQNMKPDGIVGSGTQQHIDRWRREGIVSEWGAASAVWPSSEYKKWIQVLHKAKAHYTRHPNEIIRQVDQYPKPSDTLPIDKWDFNSDSIHLIGLRREQEVGAARRINNDIFVLLINGLVFKFWGSTDPSQSMTSRPDEAFLVEGQHKYRFGWHKISNEGKVYRALKPYRNGVLVYRDRDNDNALTDADIAQGLDPSPNFSINIHWSGIGTTNFSAGCQVIAGRSYINHRDEAIDCSAFAARSYSSLNNAHRMTKGAYNMFTDLILAYARPGVDFIHYTLGRESSLRVDARFGDTYASKTLERMQNA